MLKKIQNKKAQAGLNIVIGVVIAMLTLAVLSMAALITLNSLSDSYTTNDGAGTVTNDQTPTVVKAAPVNYGDAVATFYNAVCTPTTVVNGSSNTPIGAANYTLTSGTAGTNCYINWKAGVEDTGGLNNSYWNVTYTYSYEYGGLDYIEANVSAGISEFFENAPTFFTLLAVVVIILIISLVILAVRRFGGDAGGMSTGAANEL